MRRVQRHPLSPEIDRQREQQSELAAERIAQGARPTEVWGRVSDTLKNSLRSTLERMAGGRQRCMYCVDSLATDIEHFWPKTRYPDRMLTWENLLLGCGACNQRYKREEFPLLPDGQPALVDPTAEEPWDFLDYDPKTGNLVARFDLASNSFSARGEATVNLLKLDAREALADGYKGIHRRIARVLREAATESAPDSADLARRMELEDDHGLARWFFTETGATDPAATAFRNSHPSIWDEVAKCFR